MESNETESDQCDIDEDTEVNETTSKMMSYFQNIKDGIELVNLGWTDICS